MRKRPHAGATAELRGSYKLLVEHQNIAVDESQPRFNVRAVGVFRGWKHVSWTNGATLEPQQSYAAVTTF